MKDAQIQIKLDGKSWPAVINTNLLIECEELTGMNLLMGEVNVFKPSATLLRALIYLALKHAGAPYALEQIGEMITPQNIPALRESLLVAWMASAEEPEPAAPAVA